MMEFTCDGWVRQGFGFYNPNHAAALICALLPFLWSAWFRWPVRKVRIPVLLGNVLLLAALAATFSRTGLAVLGGELLLYLLLRKGEGWKMLIGVAIAAGIAAAGFGVHERFAVDASLVHRFEIWKAGLALFGVNPWSGVGLGNSGNLAGAFLLPDGIACRTLVNSHLTLLAEFGLAAGFPWLLAQGYALLNGWRYPAAGASLAGLSVSAFTGSIFDWPVLFDFRGFGGLTVLNFSLSWGLLLLFGGLTLFLVLAGLRRKEAGGTRLCGGVRGMGLAAGGCAVVAGLLLCAAGPGPKVVDGFVVSCAKGQCPALVLYGDDWNLKQVRRFLPEAGYRVPVRPWDGEAPRFQADNVVLFGECASYASEYPNAAVTLVAPPEYFPLQPNVSRVWLHSFQEHESLLTQTKGKGISVAFF